MVRHGHDVVARLIYARETRVGFSLVRNPPLTQTVGPWFSSHGGKLVTSISQERELAMELIRDIPAAAQVQLVLRPGFDDFLPFAWAGYRVSLGCTYRLTDIADPDRVWAGFSPSRRRAVRKAMRTVRVHDDFDLGSVLRVSNLTWTKQGLRLPYRQEVVERLYRACSARNAALSLVAEDAGGRLHAAALIVYDSRCAYYLLGGADHDLRTSGAHSLLLWEAMRRLANVSATFDLEGSYVPGIERFFRGFGATRSNLLIAERQTPTFRAANSLRLALLKARGRQW